ncbi:ribonuclease III [Xylariaceae sp. FL1272]|nr:ribonuclease III [Xylariaceae sp. FL1272]
MKRIRVGQLSRPWLAAQSCSRLPARIPSTSPVTSISSQTRCQSTALTPDAIFNESQVEDAPSEPPARTRRDLPSPHPDAALQSAKLAALHARLSLSSKIPLQILARALVDPSADAHPKFNNSNLAFVGASLIQYHTSEWLITRYPRLPMTILYSAMSGYAGEPSLHRICRAWGVEAAAAPGAEVDPGYLQFSKGNATNLMHKWGYVRAESKNSEIKQNWKRGMNSRVVFDDPFGNSIPDVSGRRAGQDSREVSNERNKKDLMVPDPSQNAHANFVRAVVGAIYLYCGSEPAKTFVKSHVLSRHLDLSNLFNFTLPELELQRLCARENFDPPVARLLSETGRMSRTPVYVVGIYSGRDKLGEAAGASLNAAKTAASINAMKSWYLYSPGETAVPSDTLAEDHAPWKPAYVDMGEIIA